MKNSKQDKQAKKAARKEKEALRLAKPHKITLRVDDKQLLSLLRYGQSLDLAGLNFDSTIEECELLEKKGYAVDKSWRAILNERSRHLFVMTVRALSSLPPAPLTAGKAQ